MFVQPTELVTDLTWGDFFIPFAGESRWLTPVGAVAIVAFLLFLVRSATASRPLLDLAGWVRSSREADLRGALYLAVALGGVILAFATADPQVQVFSDRGLWYLLVAAVGAVDLRAAPPPRRGTARPPRCAATGARLGRDPGLASSSAPP